MDFPTITFDISMDSPQINTSRFFIHSQLTLKLALSGYDEAENYR